MIMTRCEPNWLTDLSFGAWKTFEQTPTAGSQGRELAPNRFEALSLDRFRLTGTGVEYRPNTPQPL